MYEGRKNFVDEDEVLIGYICMTGTLMLKIFEEVYRRYDLTQGEFIVLHCLRGKKKEVNLKYIQDNTLVLSGASVTKVTEKLVGKKYLLRRENPLSRREKLVKTTPAGAKVRERIISDGRKMTGTLFRNLSDTARTRLIKDLETILGNLTGMWDSR